MYIYVLECDLYKYYVGKTDNVCKRYNQHLEGKGAEWTKLFKSIKIIELKESINVFDEEAKTLEYMLKYGIDNVRGGSYTQIVLSSEQISLINSTIRNANGSCLTCGAPGHFSKYCKKKNFQNVVKDVKHVNEIKNVKEVKNVVNEVKEIKKEESKKNKKWSDDEINNLTQEMFEINDLYKIAKLHDRTISSIKYKLRTIVQNHVNNGLSWEESCDLLNITMKDYNSYYHDYKK